jgi:glutathione synthase/RimK-type ligase-like ATP-grasp enzyme
MKKRIWSYDILSSSAKALSDVTGIRLLKHYKSIYRPREGDIMVNWGEEACLLFFRAAMVGVRFINKPSNVDIARNKLLTFGVLQDSGVSIPLYTQNPVQVKEWIDDGNIVFGRRTLTGQGGSGIIVVYPVAAAIPDCPLYTVYIPKKEEYRVHVFSGEVKDIQRKIRDPKQEPKDWRVRSHANGFIFARANLDVPEDVLTQAKAAVSALGLDFGAVDVVYNAKRKKAYVLEVNTAPGLVETTLRIYGEEITKMVKGLQGK